MAVAFVKQSGISQIMPALKKALSKNTIFKIIAGQHFSFTEPKALYSLRDLLKNNPLSKLYLATADSKAEVFHPKLYLFKTGNTGTIICGSANITTGGLENNIECSLLIQCITNDKVWMQAIDFFHHLAEPSNSEEATLLAIKRYESFYESQKNLHNQVRPIPNRNKSQIEFNYPNLLKHFKSYNNEKRDEIFTEKVGHYNEARKVLNKIADDKELSEAKFIPLLEELVSKAGERGWWHSGSLFRKRRQVFPHYKDFQKLVQYIRQSSNQSPSVVFETAKTQVKQIEGAGVNYITEIMMTYNPDKYANLNKNPITVLKIEGDVFIKAHRNSFTGDDYEEYCELISEIISKLGLRNMLEIDSFFNDLYWKIKK
jgi:HKD family nuclease